MRISLLIVLFYALVEFAIAKPFLPKSFEANIEQQNESIVGKRKSIIKNSVVMKYMFPNNVYFEIKDKNTYVCNKQKTWVYSPPWIEGEKGQVTIGDSSKHCYVKIFDALTNGLKPNKIYTVESKGKTANLKFNKAASNQLQMSKVILVFDKKISDDLTISDVKEMKIFKTGQKDPTTFVFNSVNKDAQIKEKDFTFVVPKNTNIKNI